MELVGLGDLKFSPISGGGGGAYPEGSLKDFPHFYGEKRQSFFKFVCLFQVKACACYFFNILFFHLLKILKILKILKKNVVSMHLPAI